MCKTTVRRCGIVKNTQSGYVGLTCDVVADLPELLLKWLTSPASHSKASLSLGDRKPGLAGKISVSIPPFPPHCGSSAVLVVSSMSKRRLTVLEVAASSSDREKGGRCCVAHLLCRWSKEPIDSQFFPFIFRDTSPRSVENLNGRSYIQSTARQNWLASAAQVKRSLSCVVCLLY